MTTAQKQGQSRSKAGSRVKTRSGRGVIDASLKRIRAHWAKRKGWTMDEIFADLDKQIPRLKKWLASPGRGSAIKGKPERS